MHVPLTDGSVVGDGSQIGMFPVLAHQILHKPSTLLRSCANPRMDLVLLIVKDAAAAAASSSSPAATAPPGMSAAQFALVQRMLAARQRGAQAAAGGAVQEPKRGPQIHLVLWRMGDDSSVVWSVALSFDKLMDSNPAESGAEQEHEDVHLHDIAWSPKGDRLGVLASVRRSPVTASSTATSRSATFLRTYSVQDGRLLSTVQVGPSTQATRDQSNFADAMTLQWFQVDFAPSADAVDGSSESLLAKLPPLPQLPSADAFASAGGTANLMPHQLRMMQMSGQKPPPSFQYPSHLALQGRGLLAKIPHLAKSDADLGLVEGGDGSLLTLGDDGALPLSPETLVVVSECKSAQATLILDGQTSIGSLQLQQPTQQENGEQVAVTRTVSVSRDMTCLTCLATTADAVISCTQLQLPLPVYTRYAPSSTRRRIAAISRSSHLLRFFLGYALDVASATQQVYQNELVHKVTNEWTKHMDELSVKFGGDMKYELINVLLTGRAGPAAEQLLLGNLTEGVLTRLEQQTHTAMYSLKKLIGDSLRPALERSIIGLSGLLGQAQFFGAQDCGLQGAMRLMQATLDSTLSLANEVDLEAVMSQEFYRWCRAERERQERIKQDQDEPRLPITYDVHTVASYIDRGFENEQTKTRLAQDVADEAIVRATEGKRVGMDFKKALEEAKAFLASKQAANAGKVRQERKDVLAIVPTLMRAIEVLANQIGPMLDGGLQEAVAHDTTARNAAEGKLVSEDAPAASISSTTADQRRLGGRVCSVSFVSEHTLLSAYILRASAEESCAASSILAVRHRFGGDVETVDLTATCESPLSIIDVGFHGELELLVLASLTSTSTNVLLAFNISDIPFGQQAKVQVMPARATEFEKDFRAAKLAINTNKQTVAVTDEEGKKVVYLDISPVEIGQVAMQEEA